MGHGWWGVGLRSRTGGVLWLVHIRLNSQIGVGGRIGLRATIFGLHGRGIVIAIVAKWVDGNGVR